MSSGLTYQGLMTTLYTLLQAILRIADLGAIIAIIWFGLQMALARGDATKFNDAKKGLLYAIIGAIVIFGVYTILATVRGAVSGISGQ